MAESSNRWAKNLHRWAPLVVGVVGIAASLAAWQLLAFFRNSIIQDESRAAGNGRLLAIAREVDDQVKVARLVAPFYAATQNVDRAEFERFTTPILNDRDEHIVALMWAPRVARGDVAAHQQQFQTDDPHEDPRVVEYRVWRHDGNGGPLALDESADEYFPIAFTAGNQKLNAQLSGVPLLGMDLAQDDSHRRAMEWARDQNKTVIVCGSDAATFAAWRQEWLWAYVPIYKDDAVLTNVGQRQRNLEGFVVGVWRTRELLENVLSAFETIGLQFHLYCDEGQGDRRLLLSHPERAKPPAELPAPDRDGPNHLYIAPIGASALVGFSTPGPDFRAANRFARRPWLAAVGGSLAALLLAAFVHRATGRALRVQRLVNERTRELAEANDALQQQMREREEAQRALDESLAVHRSLIESLPLNVFRKDKNGRVISANSRFCDTLGRTWDQVVGKTDLDFFPTEQAQKYRSDDDHVIQTGEVLEDVEEHIRANGDRLYVQVLKAPVLDAQGEVVGVQGMFWDVTHRVLADALRKESDARFRRLVESNIIGVLIADLKGGIVDANDAFLQMLGYERQHLEQGELRWDQITPEDHATKDRAAVRELKEASTCNPYEKEYFHRDGRRVPVVIGVTMLEGSEEQCICFVLDITEQKEIETQLKEAKVAADTANAAKSRFLANMSHEIRTPMNAILGMTELVLNSSLNREQTEYLTLVMESAESLLAIINDVLDFSKVEAGKLELEEVPFDLYESIGDTVKALAVRAHAKDLEIACDIRSDTPRLVVGDPARIRQVVVNLVGNAIKFTERGEVLLTLFVKARNDDRVTLQIDVSDTGIGIADEKIDEIFAPFEQADSSMTRRFGGTGLGLAISKSIVEMMNGKMWLESSIGQGTTFHVSFEVTAAKANPNEQSVVDVAALRRMAVLVVDDNATNRRILTSMLANWEMAPQSADGADAALDELRRAQDAGRNYGLVICDAVMPSEDGFSFAERLKADPQLREVPIFMLTSADRPGDVERCDALGVAVHMIKPVKQSELFNAIVSQFHVMRASSPADANAADRVRRNLQILLAEDSLVNQRLACGLLEGQGHQLIVANNGREAVEKFSTGEFDLILMDVQMPLVDGIEATKRVREIEKREQREPTPIIAMTAHAMVGDRDRCLQAGMNEYVSKPIRAKQLFETIAAVVGGSVESVDEAPGDTLRTDAVVDWNAALDSVHGRESLLKEITGIFLDEAPKLIERIDVAIGAEDANELRLAAHTLKGSCRYYGETDAGRLSYELEMAGRNGNLDGAEALSERLKSAMAILTPILVDYVKS